MVIISYRCERSDPAEVVTVSAEHRAVEFHRLTELDRLALPEAYRRVIRLVTGTA